MPIRKSPDRTACPNCHERYVNVVRHLKHNKRCHRAVDEGRVLVRDFLYPAPPPPPDSPLEEPPNPNSAAKKS